MARAGGEGGQGGSIEGGGKRSGSGGWVKAGLTEGEVQLSISNEEFERVD